MTARNSLLISYIATGIVLEDLAFWLSGRGEGLALEGDVQSQTVAACFSMLNETKSVLLRTDAMVM